MLILKVFQPNPSGAQARHGFTTDEMTGWRRPGEGIITLAASHVHNKDVCCTLGVSQCSTQDQNKTQRDKMLLIFCTAIVYAAACI